MTGLVCSNGHAAVLDGQQFCAVCGAPIVAQPPVPAPPPATPAPPVWGAPGPTQPYTGVAHGEGGPPAAPPRWGAAGPPGYAGPPVMPGPSPRRGGGAVAGVLGIVAILAVVAIGGVLVLKPFGLAGGSPQGTRTAEASEAPSLAAGSLVPRATPVTTPRATSSASAKPTLKPSAKPTARPTAKPSARPTAAPSPALATCHSELGGFTTSYPDAWTTVPAGSDWSCMLFDPSPILVTPASELPDVAVSIRLEPTRYAAVVKDYKGSPTTTVTQSQTGAIADRAATALELKNNGEGYYAKGVLQTVVLIDMAARGTLVFETVGTAGDLYDQRLEGLGLILEHLAFD